VRSEPRTSGRSGRVGEQEAVEYRPTILEMPESERPRERLAVHGASALSNTELLAIVLRTGARGQNALAMAEALLARFDGLGGLARASLDQLSEGKGVGAAKAAQLLAAFELGKRVMVATPEARPQIHTPSDAAALLLGELALLDQERLVTLLLDTKHRVLGTCVVYQGNVNTSVIRVGEVFREAIRKNCPALIVAHNHPSGDPTPSPEDVRVTEQIVRAGRLLDIEVLDHLIIGGRRHVSLKERNLGFPLQGG
jgi:DNA repair protein RadC